MCDAATLQHHIASIYKDENRLPNRTKTPKKSLQFTKLLRSQAVSGLIEPIRMLISKCSSPSFSRLGPSMVNLPYLRKSIF